MELTRRSALLGLTGMTAGISPLLEAATMPRPSGEFTLTPTTGKKIQFSEYKGNVVLCQFLYTTCSHCAATATMFSKLEREFKAAGLRVVGIAFTDEAKMPQMITEFVAKNAVSFPVGLAGRQEVLAYLQFSEMIPFTVPQIVVIDRKGMIQAQSDPRGTEALQDEAPMRQRLAALLKQK